MPWQICKFIFRFAKPETKKNSQNVLRQKKKFKFVLAFIRHSLIIRLCVRRSLLNAPTRTSGSFGFSRNRSMPLSIFFICFVVTQSVFKWLIASVALARNSAGKKTRPAMPPVNFRLLVVSMCYSLHWLPRIRVCARARVNRHRST